MSISTQKLKLPRVKITLPGVRVCLRWAARPFSVQTEAQTPAQASRHLTLEADGSFGSPWRKAKAAGEIRDAQDWDTSEVKPVSLSLAARTYPSRDNRIQPPEHAKWVRRWDGEATLDNRLDQWKPDHSQRAQSNHRSG